MASTMRAVARSAKYLHLFSKYPTCRRDFLRTYLSKSYNCEDKWRESKSEDSFLKIGNPDVMFVEISRKLVSKPKYNVAVDFDIYLNALQGPKSEPEMRAAIQRLRRSRQTIRTSASTHTAIARYYLENNFEEDLVEILVDKSNFGLFPDVYTYNNMMDHFLTKNLVREAAKTAADLMFQEDPGNDITQILGLISCVRYLSSAKELPPWQKVEPVVEEEDDEIVYVRVPNLRNPWFDDHFDHKEPGKIIGMTMVHFGKRLSNAVIRDSALVIGLAQRKHWQELLKILSNVQLVSKDTVDLCKASCAAVATGDSAEKSGESSGESSGETSEDSQTSVESQTSQSGSAEEQIPAVILAKLEKLPRSDFTLLALLEEEIKNLGEAQERDVKAQTKLFDDYVVARREAKADQATQIDKEKRYAILKEKKKELVLRQEFLYAFEKLEKLEMLAKKVDDETAKERKDSDEEVIPSSTRQPFYSQSK